MLCFECGSNSSSIVHMANGGRICPKCFVRFVDGDYEPLAFQVAEWEQQFLENFDYVTDEEQEDPTDVEDD